MVLQLVLLLSCGIRWWSRPAVVSATGGISWRCKRRTAVTVKLLNSPLVRRLCPPGSPARVFRCVVLRWRYFLVGWSRFYCINGYIGSTRAVDTSWRPLRHCCGIDILPLALPVLRRGDASTSSLLGLECTISDPSFPPPCPA